MAAGDRIIRFCMVVAVLVVAGVAAYISYGHAYGIARRWGESETTARLLPLTLDGLVVAASLTGLFCSRYQLPQPWLARFALVLGIGATLAVNCIHGALHGPLAAVLAAWPAVALVVSSELLLWVVAASRSLAGRQVVVMEKPKDERTATLNDIATLVATEPSISAAEVSRRLNTPYALTRAMVKQARELLGQ